MARLRQGELSDPAESRLTRAGNPLHVAYRYSVLGTPCSCRQVRSTLGMSWLGPFQGCRPPPPPQTQSFPPTPSSSSVTPIHFPARFKLLGSVARSLCAFLSLSGSALDLLAASRRRDFWPFFYFILIFFGFPDSLVHD